MDYHKYLDAWDTAVSQDLFASGYSTRDLAYVLADEISIYANNPERVAFLEEFNSNLSAWVRGTICRALADKGITVREINFRRS